MNTALENQQWYLARQAEDRQRQPWFRYTKQPESVCYSDLVLVTPKMAEALLASNSFGRRPDNGRVYFFLAEYKKPDFMPVQNEAVTINAQGDLVDGVARLLAVIRSERDIPLFIIFNAPREASLDIGRKRNS
jgi:hypothetical protein